MPEEGDVGCHVTGVDLTAEYVEVAQVLSDRTGLASHLTFQQASALAVPRSDATFDRAVQLHVGMNVADKRALFREIRRLLGPGGRFAIYDIMRVVDGQLQFPMPWTSAATTSFVEPVATYRAELEAAGFTVVHERDRGEFATEFFGGMAARVGDQPPLGLHVIMGHDAQTKLRNMVAAVMAGVVAPIELVCATD